MKLADGDAEVGGGNESDCEILENELDFYDIEYLDENLEEDDDISTDDSILDLDLDDDDEPNSDISE